MVKNFGVDVLNDNDDEVKAEGSAVSNTGAGSEDMSVSQSAHEINQFCLLDRKKALVYHMTFHFSLELHINHMIFLHSYMFGIFTISSLGGWLSLFMAALPFLLYTIFIIKPVIGAGFYICVVSGLAVAAEVFGNYIATSDWMTAVIGLGIVLISFCCQLAGHAFYEDYFAPPALLHGFIAAPILEFQCFLYKFHSRADEFDILLNLVTSQRNVLREAKSVEAPFIDKLNNENNG